jgi:hypothetical protein
MKKTKLANKRDALVDLGRHHKIFTDKREMNSPIERRITIEFVEPPERKGDKAKTQTDEARPAPGLISPGWQGRSGGR